MQFPVPLFLAIEEQKGVNEKWQVSKKRNVKRAVLFHSFLWHHEEVGKEDIHV